MTTSIVHLDMDTFFVSVERLRQPALVGKPVIVGGTGDRGVVSACSYETRKFGVHSAMPMKMALYLCPEAIVVKGDWEAYSKKSAEVTEIIDAHAPLYEKASIDEHYIDVTGMDRFHGTARWTHELRLRIIKETGLPISFGLSPGKTISKIATDTAKPNGERIVLPHEVQAFLGPLPVQKIPGVGDKTLLALQDIGVVTIADLARLPREFMVRILGKAGLSLWERANGIDTSPVIPYHEQKSISKEITFRQDTMDLNMMTETLVGMAEALGYELRKQGRLASTLSIKIRYANFDTHTRDIQLNYTAADHVLIEQAKKLFKKIYERRMMIRLIGLKVTGLVYGHQQMRLFEESEQLMNLYQRMDGLRNKYGAQTVMRAAAMPLATIREPIDAAQVKLQPMPQEAPTLGYTTETDKRPPRFWGHRTDKQGY